MKAQYKAREADTGMSERKGPQSLISILEKAVGYLKGKNIENARLDAEVLLADILGMDRIGLYVNHDKPLNESELKLYREALAKRARRMPTAYIIGRKEFVGLDFEVNPDVLIPRPETEILVEYSLGIGKDIYKKRGSLTVLDLCTGSGAIGVSVAANLPFASIVCTDISFKAVETARRNAEKNGVGDRVRAFVGDLFEPIHNHIPGIRFDMILTNPPYLSSSDMESLQPEIRLYEPKTALFGGPDGLDFYRRIVGQAPDFLNEGGLLVMEIGAGQGAALLDLMEKSGSFGSIRVLKDYAGLDRVVVGFRL